MISTSNIIFWSISELLLIWLERGLPLVHSEYRTVSERCMVVEISAKVFRISNVGNIAC